MGIIARQSIQNVVSTYVGFGIGAINTLFLYVNFLSEEFYGLVGYLLASATLMMPLLAFGVHNTLIKFYSNCIGKERERLLSMALLLPLLLIIPLTMIGAVAYDQIVAFLSEENPIVTDYVWHILLIAIAMAYFEIFYAWAKTQLQSTFGNLMREVFHRAAVTLALLAIYAEWLTAPQFIYVLTLIYFVRMLVMMGYAFKLHAPTLSRKLPTNYRSILKYSALIILASAVAVMLLEIDMFMIGKLTAIENVAFYAVAIYIAAVIAVPARAMHQITHPISAQLLNKKDWTGLGALYKKSSLVLFVISGLLFLLIICNVKELYRLIDPQYASGLFVVLLIGMAKVCDNLIGNNNAILFNSDYYRLVLALGVGLVLLAVVLNMLFIPSLGINGAAIATFLATVGYSAAKVGVVWAKFKLQPFSTATLRMLLLLIILGVTFYFWDFSFHPLVNIGLKASLITVTYVLLVFRMRISEEINSRLRLLWREELP
ncbi:lipopolysaccharide biosynthesis protein [Croceiramulus getboli]|nr:lipopolysaccharide biosynthesis protein [Flavobacteriaceae bacterium YJPT1-3]